MMRKRVRKTPDELSPSLRLGTSGIDDRPDVIVRLCACNGMTSTQWQVVVSKAEDGGAEVAAEISVQMHSQGSVRERSAERIRRLSPEELSSFWASLEPLAWWRLTDQQAFATGHRTGRGARCPTWQGNGLLLRGVCGAAGCPSC